MKVIVVNRSTTGEIVRDAALYGNLGYQFLIGMYQGAYILANKDELITQDDKRAIVELTRNFDGGRLQLDSGHTVEVIA